MSYYFGSCDELVFFFLKFISVILIVCVLGGYVHMNDSVTKSLYLCRVYKLFGKESSYCLFAGAGLSPISCRML